MRLRDDRNFLLFWALQAISFAGDSFTMVALPLLILDTTGSIVQMGALTGTAGIAWLVTGVLAGSVVDRVDRRTLMIVCDVARGVLYGIVPLLWFIEPQVWVLYLIMPLGAAVGMLYQVAYVTAVPSIVAADRITQANGTLAATYAAAGVAGPMLAGILTGVLGPAAAIGVDGATFGVAAVAMAFVRLRARNTEPVRLSPWHGFATGARFLWRQPALRSLTLLLAAVLFLTYGLTDVFIYYLKHGLGRSDATVGYVLAVAAAGTILAGATVAWLRRRLGFGTCWIGAYAIGALAIAGVGLTGAVVAVAALVAVFVFCQGVAGTCSVSLRQAVTPDHLLGRVTSAFWTLHYLPGPVGAVLLTAATARFGVTAVTLGVGVALFAVACVATLSPVRARDPVAVPGQGGIAVIRTGSS